MFKSQIFVRTFALILAFAPLSQNFAHAQEASVEQEQLAVETDSDDAVGEIDLGGDENMDSSLAVTSIELERKNIERDQCIQTEIENLKHNSSTFIKLTGYQNVISAGHVKINPAYSHIARYDIAELINDMLNSGAKHNVRKTITGRYAHELKLGKCVFKTETRGVQLSPQGFRRIAVGRQITFAKASIFDSMRTRYSYAIEFAPDTTVECVDDEIVNGPNWSSFERAFQDLQGPGLAITLEDLSATAKKACH